MATVRSNREIDLAYIGLFLQIPVFMFWFLWFVCYIANDSNQEMVYMFYSWAPRSIWGFGVDTIILGLSICGLLLSVLEKMKRHTRWYKTVRHVRIAILLGLLFLFMNALEYLYSAG